MIDIERSGTSCTMDTSYSLTYSYGTSGTAKGQLTQVKYSNNNYQQDLTYNTIGLLASEKVTINGGASGGYTTSYGYDANHRPTTTTYPDGDIATITYNSMGLPASLSSDDYGALVDQVSYDEAGRLTQLRLARGTDLYRRQTYYPWTGSNANSNGRLKEILVGTTSSNSNRLNLLYTYDTFGNIKGFTENGSANSFSYDEQNRLTSGYGKSFAYNPDGRFTQFESVTRGLDSTFPRHGYNSSNYTYDFNGNLVGRGIVKTDGQYVNNAQTLSWDHENRLSNVTGTGISGSAIDESYLYSDTGLRAKKTSNGVVTYYPFAHYHLENGQKVKYYIFNGQPIARFQQNGGNLFYLHSDHLGSTVLETYSGNGTVAASQQYCAYGKKRSGTSCASGNALATDKHFTGQKYDSTGLHYYNARYYDDHLGTFISPDTLVPDVGHVFDYNRFMMVRGNPLKYSDPSGHSGFCDLVCSEPLVGGGGRVRLPRVNLGRLVAGVLAAGGGYAAGEVIEALDVDQQDVESFPVHNPVDLSSPPLTPPQSADYEWYTTPAGGQTQTTEVFPLMGQAGVGSNVYYDSAEHPRGGTYILRDPLTGQVMRTGRTNNLARREREHQRDPLFKDFEFEVDLRTDEYAVQRGREQMLHDLHNPPHNHINPIRPNHPRRDEYLNAARDNRPQ